MFLPQLSLDFVGEAQWPADAMQSADDLSGGVACRRRRHCCDVRQIRGTARLVDTARPIPRSGLLIEGVRH